MFTTSLFTQCHLEKGAAVLTWTCTANNSIYSRGNVSYPTVLFSDKLLAPWLVGGLCDFCSNVLFSPQSIQVLWRGRVSRKVEDVPPRFHPLPQKQVSELSVEQVNRMRARLTFQIPGNEIKREAEAETRVRCCGKFPQRTKEDYLCVCIFHILYVRFYLV